jgi:hypothetical protein
MLRELANLLIVWALLPVMATLLAVGLWQASTSYEPVNLGHAVPVIAADCQPSPDEMFNPCVTLDTTQIIDLRTRRQANPELEIP